MRTCPACGAPAAENMEVCPECGARLVPAKKKWLDGDLNPLQRAGILACIAGVFVLVLLGLNAAERFFSSPAAEFASLQREYFLNPLMNQTVQGLYQVPGDLSSSCLVLTAAAENPDVNEVLKDSSLSLNLRKDGTRLQAEGELVLEGSRILSGSASLDGEQFRICLPEVDPACYTGSLTEVLKRAGAVPDTEGTALPSFSLTGWSQLAQTYAGILGQGLNPDCVTASEEEITLEALGETFEGTLYSFRPLAADMENMVRALADQIETDGTLRTLILQTCGGRLPGDPVKTGETPAEALDRLLLEAAALLRDRAEGFGSSLEESGFLWECAAEDGELRMVRLSEERSGRGIALEIRGARGRDRTELFTVTGRKTPGELETVAELERTAKGSGTLTVTVPEGSTLRLRFQEDSSRTSPLGLPCGSWEFEADFLRSPVTLEVTEQEDGSTLHVLRFEPDTRELGSESGVVTVTLEIRGSTDSSSPEGGETDITEWNREDLLRLGRDLTLGIRERLYSCLAAVAGSF